MLLRSIEGFWRAVALEGVFQLAGESGVLSRVNVAEVGFLNVPEDEA